MYNAKFTSINLIIDKIKRGKLYEQLSHEAAIDYAVECYRLINSNRAEVTKPFKAKICNYRARLPEDLERVLTTIRTDEDLKCITPMRYASSNLHEVRHCIGSPDLSCNSNNTYSLNNDYIHTSFEDGWIFMAYKGLKTDNNGNIMVPDNVNVQLAIEFYVKWRFLDDLGVEDNFIERQKQNNETQYCWYIGKAQGAMTDLSMDEYESFANSMSKFFDDSNYHDSFMNGLGIKETIRTQHYG